MHAPRCTGAGLGSGSKWGGIEVLLGFAGAMETYYFEVINDGGCLRLLCWWISLSVTWAVNRAAAVDADESTGPGGSAASYVVVVV